MKKLLYLVGGVAVLGAAALVAVFLFSGDIIKTVVEEVGGKATQAKVTLAEVSLSPMSGEISIKVDPSTITRDVITIREVTITGPDITYELGDAGGDNIRTLQKNAQAFAASMGGGKSAPAGKPAPAPSPSSGPASKSGAEKKVIIENLYVKGGRVNVTASALAGKPLGTALPDLHLASIGKSKGGATPAEVADQVIGALAQASQAAVSKIGMDQLKGLGGAQAGELTKKLGGQMPAGLPGANGGAAGGGKPLVPPGALDRLMGK